MVGTALLLGLGSTLVGAAPALAAPGTPTDVQAIAGKRTITVQWTPAGTGDTVHHYVATAVGTSKICTALLGTNTCTISALTANTSYTVTVRACPTTSNSTNCSGESGASNAAIPGPPNSPSKPTVAYTGVPGEVEVAWTNPTVSAVGIDSFVVTPTPAVANPVGTCADPLGSGATDCVYGGLVAGTSYTFKVTAVGPGNTGSSVASTASNPIVAGPPGKPGTPEVLVLRNDEPDGADDQLLVSWSAPTSGAPPTSYTLTGEADGQGTAIPEDCGLNPNLRSCIVEVEDPEVAYTFQVSAAGGGDSEPSDVSEPVTPGKPGVPGTPTVEVTGAGAVTVSWEAPSDGKAPTSYTVTTDPGGAVGGGCGSVPEVLSCDITDLNDPGPYTFKVTAHAGSLSTESALSDEMTLAAPGEPGKPNVAVTASGAATVTWAAPTDGGPVNGYTVIADPAANLPAGCGEDIAVRSCDFVGLDPNTAYTFLVEATGSAGTTASDTSDAVTPGPPGATGTPEVVLTAPGTVTVSWTDPTTGGPVTSHALLSNQSITVPGSCALASANSCILTNLDQTLSYTFQVRAIGPAGNTLSAASTPGVKPAAPGKPDAPTVVLGGSPGSATVSWPVPSTGGPITGYTLSSNQSITVPDGCTAARSCAFTDLDPTKSYTFTVTAVGPAGSTLSDASTAVTPDAPGSPGTPNVVLGQTPGTATVSWTEPTTGGPVTSYTLASNQSISVPAGCTALGVRSCVFTDLTPSLSYTFTVTAVGPSGSTPSQASTGVKPDAPGAPGTPQVLLGETPGTATVSWAAPTTGGPVTGYTLASNHSITVPAGCTALGVRSCVFTGLDPALTYTFTVTAVGPSGSTPSQASSPAVAAAPGAPGTPQVVLGETPGTATVSWTAPTTGGPFTSYTLASNQSITVPGGCTALGVRSCVFTGLDPALSYTFTVTAVGPSGSTPSQASTAVYPATPGAPGTPQVLLGETPGTATVSWAAPTTGGPVTSYTLASNQTISVPAGCTALGVRSCVFTGLDPALSYTFTVTAVGPSGSTPSQASTGVKPDKPGTPGTPSVVLGQTVGTATVTWTAPTTGGPVTSYTLTSNEPVTLPAGCTAIGVRSCALTGLDPALSYTFTVTAIGPSGNTPSTASTGVKPDKPGAPGKPGVVNGVPGSVTLTWTAPTTGGPVDGYSVTSLPAVTPPAGCTDTTQLTCVFTGLDPAETYSFVVTATGRPGSTPSARSDTVIPGAPSAPGTPTAVVTGSGTVKVTWTASPPGAGVVNGYTVTSDPLVTPPAGCILTPELTCDFTGLDPTKAYTFLVTAVGGAGRTPSVARSAPVMPGPAGVPGTPTVQLVGSGIVKVIWTAPTSGGPVSGYSVTSDPVVTPPTVCTDIKVLSCEFTGLAPAESYTFLVTANSPAGDTPSAARSTPIKPALPGAPAAPTVQLAGPNAVLVKWIAPTGGGPVAGYSVVSEPGLTAPPGCTMVLALECTFDRLTSGTAYTFRVVVAGLVGQPVVSQPSPPITPGPPGTPGKPMVGMTTVANQVKVGWMPPNEGAGIAGYLVQSSPGDLGCTTPATATDTACLVSGLEQGVSYTFRVQALGVPNSGNSAFSVRSDPIVPGALSPPTDVDVAAGDRQIAVSWTPPANAGDRVAYYRATVNPTGLTCRSPDATGSECVITGLTNLTSYMVTVIAVGKIGTADSAPSAPSVRVRPTAGVPGAPTGVTAVGRDRSILVTWRAPAFLGDGISRYVATAASDADVQNCITDANTLTCFITGLVNARQYRVSVVAVGRSASGTSVPSTPVVVAAGAPAAPALPTTVASTATLLTSSAGATLPVGTTTVIGGGGYAPYSLVTLGYLPGPVVLTTVATDESGTFFVQVTISGAAGARTLVTAGRTSTDVVRNQRLPVTVTATTLAAARSQGTTLATARSMRSGMAAEEVGRRRAHALAVK
jgi:hypothetical protein